MRRTRWQTLLGIAVVVGVLAELLTTWLDRDGPGMPHVPWLVVAVELVLAVIVFSMGWAVRQYLRGKHPTLDPIRAARTAVLAKAACYTGALLTGWYGGQAVAHLLDRGVPDAIGRAGSAAIAAGGAVVLAVVGLVVEWFCRIPPPQDDEKAHEPAAAPDPATG
jgi:hypothetical protein